MSPHLTRYYDFDYYAFLGIPRGASSKAIKKAYRKLARKWHPDCNLGDKDLTDKFKQLVNIYEVLSDEIKREEYDRALLLSPPKSAVVPAPHPESTVAPTPPPPEPPVVRPVSKHGYPASYRIKSISEQVSILNQLFFNYGHYAPFYANERLAERPLPEGAEGYFAIPRWEIFGEHTRGAHLRPDYSWAVHSPLLGLLRQTRKYSNHIPIIEAFSLEGDPRWLYQTERTIQMLRLLSDQQKGYNILVVPAQFGFRHINYSHLPRAREAFITNEFGLGVFAVGCMLLTHPKRLISYDDLWVYCAGDVFDPYGAGTTLNWWRNPYFSIGTTGTDFIDGQICSSALRLESSWCGDVAWPPDPPSGYEGRLGSASAFLTH